MRDFAEMQTSPRSPTRCFSSRPPCSTASPNQYALFSVVSDPTVLLSDIQEEQDIDYYKIVIPREVKLEIRDKLDYINISERMLYPGLDGNLPLDRPPVFALGPKYNRRSDSPPPNA